MNEEEIAEQLFIRIAAQSFMNMNDPKLAIDNFGSGYSAWLAYLCRQSAATFKSSRGATMEDAPHV